MIRSLQTLILIGAICANFSGCSEPQCENVILQELTSPDGEKVATLFTRNCDATTTFVRALVLRKKGAEFSGGDPSSYIFTMRGEHNVKIEWIAANHLLVSRPQISKDIFSEMKVWEGANISYKSQ
jgi:hypothetical protein